MSILSDRDIYEAMRDREIVIENMSDPKLYLSHSTPFQPTTVDLHLGVSVLQVDHKPGYQVVDLYHPSSPTYPEYRPFEMCFGYRGGCTRCEHSLLYYLKPGEFVLGQTDESIEIDNSLVGRLDGKSTLGRIGLMVHCTAGLVDPGWNGHLTLELSNIGPVDIILRPGMPIAQIGFTKLTTPCARPYGSLSLGSHYQNDTGVRGARVG